MKVYRVYRRHLVKRLPLFAFVTVVASVVLLSLSFRLSTDVPSRVDEERPGVPWPPKDLTQKIDKPGTDYANDAFRQREVLDPTEKIDWHDEEFMRAEGKRTGWYLNYYCTNAYDGGALG